MRRLVQQGKKQLTLDITAAGRVVVEGVESVEDGCYYFLLGSASEKQSLVDRVHRPDFR